MRDDFNRVLTEDPRRGSRNKFTSIRRSKLNATFDDEFSGGKESMMAHRRRQKKQNRKTFGDHLGPLERWVRKNVGKNWDDLYSEISRLFDQRSQIKYHVHQHLLGDFVQTETKLIDGEVCVFDRWDGWVPVKTNWRRNFYVHPVTRVLCSAEKEPGEPGAAKKAAEALKVARDAVFRVYSNDEHLYLVDGVWWVYTISVRRPPKVSFVRPYWWPFQRRAEWDNLTPEEKEAQGTKQYEHVDIAIPAPGIPGFRYLQSALTAGYFYSARRVAGRKYLKRFGLVGTAEYNEDDGARSHREMQKYRQL